MPATKNQRPMRQAMSIQKQLGHECIDEHYTNAFPSCFYKRPMFGKHSQLPGVLKEYIKTTLPT
jgi:hypothetical protein